MSGWGFSNISVVSGGIRVPVEPGGPAGGDLTGSYKDPIVAQIQQYPVDPRMPTNGDTLIFNGGEWIPTPSPTSTTYFQGVWNADTNTPDIANFPGLSDGYVWIVGVAGNTNVGGITGWLIGDYAVYSNGNWYKLSASSFGWLLGGNNGTTPNVNYIGTADEHDLSIRANEIEKIRLLWNGEVVVSESLKVTGNLTASNAKLSGDLSVCGGDITTNQVTFNLINSAASSVNFAGGATSFLNIGNTSGCITLSGSTKFPMGLSGSLTRLTDGTSAFVSDVGMLISSVSNGAVTFKVDDSKFAALTGSTFTGVVNFNAGLSGSLTKLTDGTSAFISDTGIIISSASNGAVTFKVDDSKFAALTGSTFTGAVTFNAGLSGSLTKLSDGTSYLIAGTNMSVVTNSNGSITLTAIPSGSSTQIQFNDGGTVFGGNPGFTFDKTTSSVTVSGDITGSSERLSGNLAVNGGSVTTTAGTFNLANSTATTVNIGAGATTGLRFGNSAGINIVSGTTQFPQGLSGSLTKLTDGTSAFIAGSNIAITSASNGPVTVAFSTTPAAASDVLVFNGTTWAPSNIINTLQTSYQTVRAQGAIAAGDVCYIVNAGGSNDYPTVAKAQANSLATCKGVIGLATANIANNTTGSVQTYGQLPGPVTTNTFSQGAPLFVSPTVAGGVTDVKPSGPNIAFQVGFVTRQGQPNNVTTGIVFVSPMQETNTQNINDFVFTAPAEHEVITYEASTMQWKNKQPLWVANTQVAVTLANGAIITAANFLNVVYLPINTQGGANITLNASTPIASLTKTSVDYGRELWLHNLDNNRNITIPAGGNVKLDGGVNLVLAPNAIAKFVWTGIGGNGSWVQTSKSLVAS